MRCPPAPRFGASKTRSPMCGRQKKWTPSFPNSTPTPKPPPPGVPEKSIAVLPFENRSEEKANAYFTEGIQDEILTRLSKIADLKVISRTSVMPYRGQAHDAREIGHALNVATILEGSVRREGKRVRVNVQLIDAANDKHLWAQIYDRELTDVFAIQTDLAQEIASALRATLSPGEQKRIESKPTQNADAYLLYLQAHEIFTRPDRRHDDVARLLHVARSRSRRRHDIGAPRGRRSLSRGSSRAGCRSSISTACCYGVPLPPSPSPRR